MTREQRKRELRRNMALMALAIAIMVGGTCLINILYPPVGMCL